MVLKSMARYNIDMMSCTKLPVHPGPTRPAAGSGRPAARAAAHPVRRRGEARPGASVGGGRP